MAGNARNPNVEERSLSEDFRRTRAEAQALGSELGDLAHELRYLLQKEAELAKAEVTEAAGKARQSLIFGAVAAVFAGFLLLFGYLTLMFALDLIMPLWAAAAITAGVLALKTAILGGLAYARMKQMSIKPRRTVRSVQEDIEWAKTRIRFTTR